MINKAMLSPGMLSALVIILCLGLLQGCGTGGLTDATSTTSAAGAAAGGTGTETGAAGTEGGIKQVPTQLKLTASPIAIRSGNVDTATITATVLDVNNASVKNQIVNFTADGGQISDTSAITDANGRAQITLSSGTINPSNQVVNITGIVTGIKTSTVPVTVTGSTLTLTTDKTNITNDGSVASKLTLTAKDAAGSAVFAVPISISAGSALGDGGVSLAADTGYEDKIDKDKPNTPTNLNVKTDALGQFVAIVTGTAAGPVTLTADWLKTKATQAYTVSDLAGVFGFTAPADNPHPLTTGDPLTVTVSAPSEITKVRFAATLGGFDTGAGGTASVFDVTGSGSFSVTFSSNLAGVATIQASDFNNPATTASLGVVVSAPASAAAQLTLQPSVSSVRPSNGGVQNTAKITATVKNSSLQTVGGAPVAFSIRNPTGGGETISPVVVFTDGTGTATTTFTSGSLPSDANGVLVDATVLDIASSVTATTKIVIGGTPGSVVIGRGSRVVINTDNTTYSLPMVVQVTDSNGNAVPGTTVSLSTWPTQYSSGFWYDTDLDPDKDKFAAFITGTFVNEDTNENMFKDKANPPTIPVDEDVNLNGILDPPNSAAGAVPATVQTDENGLGNFFVTYPKQSAIWIESRLRASVTVSGTETTSFVTFTLPAEKGEAESGILPTSNYHIELTVSPGNTVTFNFPFFPSTAAALAPPTTYSTTSASSTIPAAGGLYSFTAPPGAPSGLINDEVIISSFLGIFRVPVRVRVQ